MSIEGMKFCDVCGGVVGINDVTPLRVDEEGHLVLLHLHNRHANDCLAKMLTQLAEQYASTALVAAAADSQYRALPLA
jgi:hypothetical protein